MSIADRAIQEADGVIGSIIELAQGAIAERRKHAAWWYVYRSRRAQYARTKVAKRYWSWLARRSRAQMAANEATCCEVDGAMSRLPGGGAV